MTLDEAQGCIDAVLKAHSNLSLDAHGLSRSDHSDADPVKRPIQPQEFAAAVEWLLGYDGLDRRKTINTCTSSYGWKHVAERELDTYISNGAFICAALYLNYKMRRQDRSSPNAYFNLRKDTRHALR